MKTKIPGDSEVTPVRDLVVSAFSRLMQREGYVGFDFILKLCDVRFYVFN